MIYTDFHGEKLSLLGFGTMRLPLVPGGGPADIDEKTTADMVRYAMDHGVNYFDTAYPYHGGMSERVIGRVLKDYDRQSFYLATKYPGHQISDSYDPAAIFEEQLREVRRGIFRLLPAAQRVREVHRDVYRSPLGHHRLFPGAEEERPHPPPGLLLPRRRWSCWRTSCPATARTWSSVRSS
ncbi:MAG: aldo/keto reductase [Oscillospiraceae bacterium]